MRNAKKTLSLVMIAIFTTFIVLSGIPAGAVTAAAAKAQVTKATTAVVKVEKTVKVSTFNVTTAQTQLTAANKEVSKVKTLGKTYAKTYAALAVRTAAVNKKIAAKKLAIEKQKAALAKAYADANKAVEALEKAVDADNVDLVADAAALATAQGAVTSALEYIEKLDKNSSNYKGLMARVDMANTLISDAVAEVQEAEAAAEKEAADKAAKEAAAKLEAEAQTAAETAVKAVEDAVAANDFVKADTARKEALVKVDAVKDVEKNAAFAARLAAAYTKTQPAIIKTVTAIDGIITVNFDKKPITTVAAADFTVNKTVTTTSAVTTAVVPTGLTVVSDTAVTLAVPAVAAATTAQSVVYDVKLATGAAVSAAAFVVAQLPTPAVTAKTTNNKQVVLTFNTEMDATAATTLANYTYTGVATLTEDPVLSADKKSVVITLTGSEAQQAAATLKIANLKSAAGVAMATTTLDIVFLDTVLPVAQSVTLTGPTTLKVTFSEPVNAVGTYTIDNNTYSVSSATLNADDINSVDVVLGAPLPAGAHSVKITGVTDFAPFTMPTATLNFNYATDASVPVVSLASATQTTVKLAFSKPIDAATIANLTVYHTYNKNAAYQGAVSVVDSQNVTVTFTTNKNYLPIGTATIYVNAGTSPNLVKDTWGNALAAASFTAAVTADTAAPTVTSVTRVNNTNIDVTFSEAVTGVVPSVFTLKDSTAKTLAITGVTNTTGNVYRVTTSGILNGNTFTLTIAGAVVADKAVVPNYLAAYTNTFVVGDTVAPTVAKALVNPTRDAIYVYFSEPMSTTGLTSVSNYYYVIDGSAATALPADSTVTIVDTKTVKITLGSPLAAGFIAGGDDYVYVVGALADVTGNTIGGLYASIAPTSDALALANVSDVYAKSLTKISFVVDKELKAIDVTKFTVDGVASSVTGATYVNNSGEATVTLTVDKAKIDMGTDLSGVSTNLVELAAGAMTTSFGSLSDIFNIAVAAAQDTIVPTLTSTVITALDTIELTYSEAMMGSTISIYTYSVAGSVVKNAVTVGNKVTLTLDEALTGTIPTVSIIQTMEIKDANGNKVAASTTAFAEDSELIIPQIVTVTESADAKVLTVTFSEAMDKALIEDEANWTFTPALGAVTLSTVTLDVTGKVATVTLSGAALVGDTLLAEATLTDANGNIMDTTKDLATRSAGAAGAGTYGLN